MKLFPPDHVPLGGHGKTASIPHAKKPKLRPPRGWRDMAIFPGRSLPTYTGPYAVGTMEIEVPARHPRSFSHIRREGRHLLRLETVLMTVYYPTDVDPVQFDSKQKMDDGGDTNYKDSGRDTRRKKPCSRELWLGRPRLRIAEGYGRFAGVGKLAVPFFFPAIFTKLPAYRNAPLAEHWAPAVTVKDEGTKVEKGETGANSQEEGEKKAPTPGKPCFPLVLFSHGLGGTRTMYSSVCGEFASYGFVVIAVEHRDGSGPRTYVNHPPPGDNDEMEERATDDEGVDHNKEEKRQGYDVLDYIFPKGNPMDTSPNNEKGVDTELRSAQIALRMSELDEAYQVMSEIVRGEGQKVADRNLRQKGAKASSSMGLAGVDWKRWKDRVRLDYVTACGHSFGAATVAEILRHDDQFHYVSQGIIYDIWGAATRPPEKEAPHHRIHAPLLAVMSEAFTYWPSNFELVKSLVEEAQSSPHPSPSWLMTLRGTVHISQSDFSLLYPHVSSLILKMVANPRRALDLNINASLEFLSKILPQDLAMVNRAYQSEDLLESPLNPLNRIPSTMIHRPKDKYVAARLRIHHELMYRISPKLFRQLKRKQYEREGRAPETADEVWLHVRPTDESLQEHQRSVDRFSDGPSMTTTTEDQQARPQSDSPCVSGSTLAGEREKKEEEEEQQKT